VRRNVLDTSLLIAHWWRCRGRDLAGHDAEQARDWARALIRLEQTDKIVTPVVLEMLCGVRDRHELELTRAYLDCFAILDEGNVSPRDWEEARRLAQRVPRNCKPRHLGDCLIRAIADRLHHDVRATDEDFPS
jgi:predicted nucleic acid-binding protein